MFFHDRKSLGDWDQKMCPLYSYPLYLSLISEVYCDFFMFVGMLHFNDQVFPFSAHQMLSFIHAQKAYFHQGHDLFVDLEPQLNLIANQVSTFPYSFFFVVISTFWVQAFPVFFSSVKVNVSILFPARRTEQSRVDRKKTNGRTTQSRTTKSESSFSSRFPRLPAFSSYFLFFS